MQAHAGSDQQVGALADSNLLTDHPACGVPGHISYWTADLDEWARRKIRLFDAGTIGSWDIRNCRSVTSEFFGPAGRVFFGVASSTQLDEVLQIVEGLNEAAIDNLDDFVRYMLQRVRRSACRGYDSCRCSEFRTRARQQLARCHLPIAATA